MRGLMLCMGLAVCAVLAGCEKPVHPNDLPVSHWLKDQNACIRKTAQSIIQSGRPWPNEVIDERPNQFGQFPLVRYDLWVADQLYELPGKGQFLRRNGFDSRHAPWKYTSVSGNLEDVLGIPQQRFKDYKVGGTLFGNLICQIDGPSSNWIENRAHHAPTREALIQKIVAQIKAKPDFVSVQVKERDDIKMAEINVTTTSKSYVSGYVPRDMKQILYDGTTAYKAIGCREDGYDPDADLFMSGNCHVWLTLAPGIYIQFWVYQHYLPFLPALHDHMLRTLESSRRK
jgi:hypothetical protein